MSEEMKQLRRRRNALLRSSDWTQSNDSPLSDSKKNEWKTYRQSLRDITKTASPKITEHGLLLTSSVTWPTKPT